MNDKYLIIQSCCEWPRQMLIWEPSMGYEPFIHCVRCNHSQHFPEEEE